MVDIWLIFNLFLPFSEVFLHTYLNHLRYSIYNLWKYEFILPLHREDKEIPIAKVKPGTECVSRRESMKLFTFRSSTSIISEDEKIKVCLMYFIQMKIINAYRIIQWLKEITIRSRQTPSSKLVKM